MSLLEQITNPGILILGGIVLIMYIAQKVLEHTKPNKK